jgi:6-pyruvoyl-tetrahydropterin synthase
MFTLRVEHTLHAHHAVTLYDGVQEAMHEHLWRFVVQVSSDDLDTIGAVMDFRELQRHLEGVLAPLQGVALNDAPAFAGRNPTNEAVMVHVFEGLLPLLPARVRLDEVLLLRDGESPVTFGVHRRG